MTGYRLERARVRSGFDRAAAQYDKHAVLQAKLRAQLLERLGYVDIQPQIVADLGSGTGQAAAALQARYREAAVLALDCSAAMLAQHPGGHRVLADTNELPLRDGSVGLLFANLLLPFCDDPDGVLREWRRVMAPHSLVTFTTLGPDTLRELRAAWHAVDPGAYHLHGFIDMHDIGDALVRAGFAEPVMDVERYTLTYDNVHALLSDLHRVGSRNALPQRPRGLMGRRKLERLGQEYERFRTDGRLPATAEVVFGQAWCPGGRPGEHAVDGIAAIGVNRIGHRRRGPAN